MSSKEHRASIPEQYRDVTGSINVELLNDAPVFTWKLEIVSRPIPMWRKIWYKLTRLFTRKRIFRNIKYTGETK